MNNKQQSMWALGLTSLMIAAFMDLADNTSISVALSKISESLHASPVALQWITAGNILILGLGLITGGKLGDKYGHRKIFLIGLIGYMLSSLACGAAGTEMILVASRLIQGLFSALLIPQIFGIIRSSFPKEKQAIAYGVYGGVLSLASISGPMLGGFLVGSDLLGMGWRSIFLINIPLALIALYLGRKYLIENKNFAEVTIDYPGALTMSIATLLVLAPFTLMTEYGWSVWSTISIIASGIVFALLFARSKRMEQRNEEPVISPVLFENKPFNFGLLSSLLFFSGISVFFMLFSLYLSLGVGKTPFQVGLAILPYALGSFITSGVGVKFASKAGRMMLVIGSLLTAASMGILWVIVVGGAAASYLTYFVPVFIGGLGIGLVAPILVNIVLAGINQRQAGVASATLNTVNQIGGAAGIALIGSLFFLTLSDSLAKQLGALQAYSTAMATVLPWLAAIYVITALCMMMLPKKTSEYPQ